MLEKSSRFFAVPIFFRHLSLPGLAQKPGNVSPTVWNIGIAGKFLSWTLSSNNCFYIFPFFYIFPQKKRIKSKSSKKNQLCNPQFLLNPKKKRPFREGRNVFPVFFPPGNLPVNRNRKPPLNLGGRAAPSGSLLSPGGGVSPKRSL